MPRRKPLEVGDRVAVKGKRDGLIRMIFGGVGTPRTIWVRHDNGAEGYYEYVAADFGNGVVHDTLNAYPEHLVRRTSRPSSAPGKIPKLPYRVKPPY